MSTELAPPPAPPATPPPTSREVVTAIYAKLHEWGRVVSAGRMPNTLLLGAPELVALNAYVRGTLPELDGTVLSEGDTFAGMNIKRALSGLSVGFLL